MLDDMKSYTLSHFKRLAKENRFPENAKISHEENLCLLCHPEKIEGDAFDFFLDLVVQCIAERRPVIDASLVKDIQEEGDINGVGVKVTIEGLLDKSPEDYKAWRLWAWNAINTAFDMLSIHSKDAPYFQLEDKVDEGRGDFVRIKIDELFNIQRSNTLKQTKGDDKS